MILEIQRKIDLFISNPSKFPRLEPVQISLDKF
jgi:hypothetical protein